MDGWGSVQNMTGHPSDYLYAAFPDGVKTERVDKDEKGEGVDSILESECPALVEGFCQGGVFDGDRQTLKVFSV